MPSLPLAMTAHDRENANLVEGLRAQDPAVARCLWQRFAPRIFRLLRRTLGADPAVEDAVAVVLLCVFHRGRRVQADADLGALVLKVTARVAQAQLRRRTVRRFLMSPRRRAAQAPAARDSSGAQDQETTRFYRILDRLSAADRIAFVFHHVENLELPVVAAAMGGTVVGTKRRIRRALARLFDAIQRDPLLRVHRG